MFDADQCRAFADEYKTLANNIAVSEAHVRVLRNIARTLTGLATQHEILADLLKEERSMMGRRQTVQQARPFFFFWSRKSSRVENASGPRDARSDPNGPAADWRGSSRASQLGHP
jgi:hypothetical protein